MGFELKNKYSNSDFMHWRITKKCNYNCNYCFNDFSSINSKKENDTKIKPYSLLIPISKYLKGSWKIFICGSGEPFVESDFLTIVRKLIEMGHKIGVGSNLSFPTNHILKFCELTGKKLFRFDASLHLDHADPTSFLKKVLKIKEVVGDRIRVFSVTQKGKVSDLNKIAKKFDQQRIKFYMQPEKEYSTIESKKNPFVQYSKKEKNIIKHHLQEFFEKNKIFSRGRLCFAGKNYFVLTEDGSAWRCNICQREKDKTGYLGNMVTETFVLNKKPQICKHEYCSCVDPILLGMVKD